VATKPFWLGIIIPLVFADNVSSEEYDEGFGTAQCDVKNDKFHMVFRRTSASDDGIVQIKDYWNLGEEVAREFGYKEIIIQHGEYIFDFLNNPEFVETFFDANFR